MDRRPLASRGIPLFQALARGLASAGVSPNLISGTSLVFGCAAGLALWRTRDSRWAWLAAAALVQLRLIANMLDGMVAVEGGRTSRLGELFNEIPDRVSDTATLVGLGFAAGGHILLGFSAALAAMMTAYIRSMGKVAGAPQDFSGPMAKPHRMFVVTLVCLYSGLAPAAWQPSWPLPTAALGLILAGSLLTCARRLARVSANLKGP